MGCVLDENSCWRVRCVKEQRWDDGVLKAVRPLFNHALASEGMEQVCCCPNKNRFCKGIRE